MNPAHIHLLVNHLPIVGQFFQIAALPGVSHQHINLHCKNARRATIASLLTVLAGLIVNLIALLGGLPIKTIWYLLLILCAGATAVSMVLIGNLGGKIRHQEVRGEVK